MRSHVKNCRPQTKWFRPSIAATILGLGAAAVAGAGYAEDDPKEQIALLYMVQIAPKACKWENVGDSSKLDAKVAETEKALGLTDAEKTKFRALAAQNFKAGSEDCDPKGMARAMYDEAIK